MHISEICQLRSALKQEIQSFFFEREYLELETPILVACPGTEKYLEYFRTDWKDYHSLEHPRWLRSSPELHMKQGLGSGLSRIFQIGKCFRNFGELSDQHHPEFTMLEWYEAGIDFTQYVKGTLVLLEETQTHMQKRFPNLCLSRFDFSKTQIFTLKDAFANFVGLDLFDGDPDLARKAKEKGVRSVQLGDDFESAFFKILLERIEPELERLETVVLWDYPPSQAALARVENGAAKRFEVYIRGVELCNGFYELLGAEENRARIAEANAVRKELGKEITLEDPDFYGALERGIPECCGNALGFDRWLALLAGTKSIQEVIPFRSVGLF